MVQVQVQQSLRLGEWLVRRGLLQNWQRNSALACCGRLNCRVGDAVVNMGWLDRESMEEEVEALGSYKALFR